MKENLWNEGYPASVSKKKNLFFSNDVYSGKKFFSRFGFSL